MQWKTEALSEIAFMTSGGTPSKKHPEYYKDGTIPWVRSGELENGAIRDTEIKITQAGLDASSAKIFPKGTLLIALYGATIGKLAYLDIEACTNQAVCGIFENEKVSQKYLYYFLLFHRPNLIKQGIGGAQPNISQTILKKMMVSYPCDKAEQLRIVGKIEELSSRLDASVAELQTAKEKLSAYRQAVLKEAFANSTRTELVEMSEIAEDIRIGPFGTMLHKSDYISDGVPVINPQHIKNLSIIPSRKITVSQEMAVELSSYRLRENDIIMGRRGEMGRAAAITKSEAGWICGTGSLLFQLKPEYDASFYAQILSSPDIVHYLEDHATGTTMKNLNEHIVKHIPVPKVTKQMQKVIVSRLEEETSICDSIGQAIDTSLRQAESLRQSILKQAFEGNL